MNSTRLRHAFIALYCYPCWIARSSQSLWLCISGCIISKYEASGRVIFQLACLACTIARRVFSSSVSGRLKTVIPVASFPVMILSSSDLQWCGVEERVLIGFT